MSADAESYANDSTDNGSSPNDSSAYDAAVLALARRRRRRFTLLEARRTLPLVTRIAADVVRTHADARALHSRLTRRLARQERHELEVELDSVVNKLKSYVDELTDIGAELKDYQHGLIDFVTRHDGRDVYLCWKLGEADITHWHELNEGVQGRQPVSILKPD